MSSAVFSDRLAEDSSPYGRLIPDVVIMHPHADLIVKVKKDDENKHSFIYFNSESNSGFISFMVLAGNMASASPVWHEMIFGNPTEPLEKMAQVIEMDRKDCPGAMKTLLHIVHYEFDKVEEEPTNNEMYEITALTRRYKCAHLLFPFADSWSYLLSRILEDRDALSTSWEEAVQIAWELGDVKTFKGCSDALAISSVVDKNGDLAIISDNVMVSLKYKNLPDGLLSTYIFPLTII
jgi:hypothetical protein